MQTFFRYWQGCQPPVTVDEQCMNVRIPTLPHSRYLFTYLPKAVLSRPWAIFHWGKPSPRVRTPGRSSASSLAPSSGKPVSCCLPYVYYSASFVRFSDVQWLGAFHSVRFSFGKFRRSSARGSFARSAQKAFRSSAWWVCLLSPRSGPSHRNPSGYSQHVLPARLLLAASYVCSELSNLDVFLNTFLFAPFYNPTNKMHAPNRKSEMRTRQSRTRLPLFQSTLFDIN